MYPARYAIYLRKSRADAEAEAMGQGETLARHRRTLTELAAARGLDIGETYEEIVSGDTIADRPEMQRLLSDVQAGRWQGVLVMEIERLARGDSIDQGIVAQTFKYSNTLIVTPAKTYDPQDDADEEFFEFSLFMARREYKTIKRRLQAGRLASVREGKYMGTRPPFGYRRIKLQGEKGWSLEIIPDQADIVRMIYQLYLHGENGQSFGCDKIADRINAMGIRTWGGREWSRSSVRNILSNPIYVGKVQWYQRETVISMQGGARKKVRPISDKHLVVHGRHQPIVSQQDWDAVAKILSGHVKPSTSSTMVNPFSGLIVCGECGRIMQLQSASSGPRYAPRPYIRCMKPHCKTVRIELRYVEEAILNTLTDWANAPDLPASDAASPAADTHAADLAAIDKQIATLHAQLDRARDLLEQDIYDTATYLNRQTLLRERIKAAERTRASLLDSIRPTQSPADVIRALRPQILTVLTNYATASTPAEKNALLRTVVSKIIFHRTERVYRGQNPAATLKLDVFPRID